MNNSSTHPVNAREHLDIPEQHAHRQPSDTPYLAYILLAALLVIATAAATGLAAGAY